MENSVNDVAGETQIVNHEEETSNGGNKNMKQEDDRLLETGVDELPIFEELAVEEAVSEDYNKRGGDIFLETEIVDEQISESQDALIDPEEAKEQKNLCEAADIHLVVDEMPESQNVLSLENSRDSSDVTEAEVKSAEERITASLDVNLLAEMVSEGVNWIGNSALPNTQMKLPLSEVLDIMGLKSNEATIDKASDSVSPFEDGEIKHPDSESSNSASKDAEISDSSEKIGKGLNENSNESLQPTEVEGKEDFKGLTCLVELPSSNENVDTGTVLESPDVMLSSGDININTIEKTSELIDSGSNGYDLGEPGSDFSPTVESSGVLPEQGNEAQIHESAENETTIDIPSAAAETTSWRSCCGMFDVLRGSNR